MQIASTKQLFTLLRLQLKDKELKDSLIFANAHLWQAIIPILIGGALVMLALHTANYVFGEGDAYQILIHVVIVLPVLLLYPTLYRCKRELTKWLTVLYMLGFSICTPLLYMRKLGPFNPSNPAHYQYSLLINFLFAVFVNEHITVWINCLLFLVSTIFVVKAECENPYNEI